MPTLFRFLMVLGVIAGVVSGSLYVLAEYFQPHGIEFGRNALFALRLVPRSMQDLVPKLPPARGQPPRPKPSRERRAGRAFCSSRTTTACGSRRSCS